MTTLIDKINQIEFLILEDELPSALDTCYELGSVNLTQEESKLFRHDLDFFYQEKGRFRVHNTFAGGIIYLREPEIINKLDLQFQSETNQAVVSVVYSSEKRHPRNISQKPNAGQIESTTWNMLGIFPNFNKHQEYIKVLLMAIIGNIAKQICEYYKKESWFMQFEKPFAIELFLDNKLMLTYNVEIES